ncbi:hypothetical protein HDU81_008313 [Chytriomyces hyalinus]|nr:hypothetical protein HDU81_008313 [Chytriomyces hyalinus]
MTFSHAAFESRPSMQQGPYRIARMPPPQKSTYDPAQSPHEAPLSATAAAVKLASTIKRGRIVHAHIYPQISNLVPLEWEQNLVNESIETASKSNPASIEIATDREPDAWIKDLTAQKTCRNLPNPEDYPIRIHIHPLELQSDSLYAQCHRITLKSPIRDAFFHWTFLCHQFNFRTMARSFGWKVQNDGVENESFAAFGELVKARIRDCFHYPDRFPLHMEVVDPENLLLLTFSEIRAGYRKVTLLSLEFVPSPWFEVVADLRRDYKRTRRHYSDIHNNLVQSLDFVLRHQPALLVSGGVPDPLEPQQLKPWKDLVADLLENKVSEKGKVRLLQSDEKIVRKKLFVLLTLPKHESLEVVAVKSMKMNVQGYERNEDAKRLRLMFTFYAKRFKQEPPSSYIITITAAEDVFFTFTSKEITPAVFHSMTSSLNLHTHIELPDRMHVQPRGTELDSDRLEERQCERRKILGFLPTEGVAGGVVGVLADDLLQHCENEPDRYSAVFKIRNRAVNHVLGQGDHSSVKEARRKLTNKGPSEIMRTWKMEDVDGTAVTATGVTTSSKEETVADHLQMKFNHLHTLTSRNPPQLRKAYLEFTETCMFRSRKLMIVEFSESRREVLQEEIRERYDKLQTEIDSVQYRLDALYDTVRRKNPSLLASLTDAITQNQSQAPAADSPQQLTSLEVKHNQDEDNTHNTANTKTSHSRTRGSAITATPRLVNYADPGFEINLLNRLAARNQHHPPRPVSPSRIPVVTQRHVESPKNFQKTAPISKLRPTSRIRNIKQNSERNRTPSPPKRSTSALRRASPVPNDKTLFSNVPTANLFSEFTKSDVSAASPTLVDSMHAVSPTVYSNGAFEFGLKSGRNSAMSSARGGGRDSRPSFKSFNSRPVSRASISSRDEQVSSPSVRPWPSVSSPVLKP